MNTWPLAQPTHPLRQELPPAPRDGHRGRLHVTSAVVGSLLVAVLAGCSGDANGNDVSPLTTASATPTAAQTAVDEQAALLAQYRKFWAQLTPVSRMSAGVRRAALTQYTVDPELKSLLAGMVRIDSRAQVYYGADLPRATQASISSGGTSAVVDDCLDSRNSGIARRSDLAPLTQGIARNHVVVTMKKTGEVWKVYFVAYTKTPC